MQFSITPNATFRAIRSTRIWQNITYVKWKQNHYLQTLFSKFKHSLSKSKKMPHRITNAVFGHIAGIKSRLNFLIMSILQKNGVEVGKEFIVR